MLYIVISGPVTGWILALSTNIIVKPSNCFGKLVNIIHTSSHLPGVWPEPGLERETFVYCTSIFIMKRICC